MTAYVCSKELHILYYKLKMMAMTQITINLVFTNFQWKLEICYIMKTCAQTSESETRGLLLLLQAFKFM